MRTMKLSDIKIREAFVDTTPSEEKMQECRENWNKWHRQDRYIVVDREGFLIDGYVQYLVLKENSIDEAEIKTWHCRRKRWARKNVSDWEIPKYRNEPTTYVFGYHPNCKVQREFMWRIPKSWTWMVENIQIGDTIICATKFGYAPVVVTKIEILDKCPTDLIVKKVVGKEIRRNGVVVELGQNRSSKRKFKQEGEINHG